jgi:hypothetical protein
MMHNGSKWADEITVSALWLFAGERVSLAARLLHVDFQGQNCAAFGVGWRGVG